MKLVQFSDGSYGVKRASIFGEYLDFEVFRRMGCKSWRNKGDTLMFCDCKTTKEEALGFLFRSREEDPGEKRISNKEARVMWNEIKGQK